MILSVGLKNWKSHKNTFLKFGDGTNVLVGNNGTGKSSVLDAIAYGLFGTLPGIKNRKHKLEDLITNRPEEEERAEVEITFRTPEEEEYTVKRCIERGRGTVLAELHRTDGELVEGGGSERVTERVGELLKITYDMYERAIYSEQNQLDMFLEIQKGKRRESIDELLGIKRYEKARKNLSSLANTLQERAKEREREALVLKKDSSIAQIPALEQEIGGLLSEARRELEEAEAIGGRLEVTRKEYGAMQELEGRLRKLETEYSRVKARKDEISDQLEKLKREYPGVEAVSLEGLRGKLGDLGSRVEQRRVELKRLEERKSQLERAGGQIRERSEALKKQIGELRAEVRGLESLRRELEQKPLGELEGRLRELKETKTRYEGEVAVARSRIREVERAIEELEKAEAQCPVCEAPLDTGRKQELLERRRGEIEKLRNEVGEGLEEIQRLQKEIPVAEREWKEALVKQRELEKLPVKEQQMKEKEEELSRVILEMEKISKESGEVERALQAEREGVDAMEKELSELREMERARSRLDEIVSRLEETERRLEEMESRVKELRARFDAGKLRELQEEVVELSKTHAQIQERAKKKRELAEEKRKRLEEIRKKVFHIKRLEAEVRHLREFSQTITGLHRVVGQVQVELRNYFLNSVNEVMNDLWSDLYPYGDFVKIRLSVDENSNDYVLQLQDRSGNWSAVDGGVSGGERSTACLALRVAFSLVLAPSLRWIVFDEPTHNLDSQTVEELARVLRERLPEVVKQVILITHDEKLEEAVSGFLYRFYRDKRADEPTRYELVTTDVYGGV